MENILSLTSSDYEFLEILINNTIFLEKNKYELDFEGIENELADRIIPGLKRFNEGEIRVIKYYGEQYNEIDEQIINDFSKKYKFQELNKNQKDYIREFIQKNNEKNNLLLSLQYVMVFILNHSEFKENTNIKEVIEEMFKTNFMKEKIEIIKSFLDNKTENEIENEVENDAENEEPDLLEQMNNPIENEEFNISYLYSIFLEIKNIK